MKIAILSDIHFNHYSKRNTSLYFSMLNQQIMAEKPRLVLLAGDFADGEEGYKEFLLKTLLKIDESVDWEMTVIAVPGNHDHYDGHIGSDYINNLRFTPPNTHASYFMLNKESVNVDGVTILVTTLWSNLYNDHVADIASRKINDFVYIHKSKLDSKPISSDDYNGLHRDQLNWLNNQFEKNPNGKFIVMTHHAPSYLSIHPIFAGSELNSVFTSDLDTMILRYKPLLWIHGHTHAGCDYMLGKTRVINNARGYPFERFGRSDGYQFIELDVGRKN